MRSALLLSLSLLFATALLSAAETPQTIQATTTDGRQVALKPDGTWNFVQQPSNASKSAGRFVKASTATKKISAPFGQFALWIDPKHWTVTKNERGKIMLQSVDGKGFAMIISEAISIPTNALRELAVENIRRLDPNGRVVAEDLRVVNNREVVSLQMEASVSNIPFTYFGYYYGGTSGNVQVVTYTVRSGFDAMKPEFTELLNGLEISDNPVPSAPAAATSDALRTISLNDGKLQLSYDPRKWNEPRKSKDSNLSLSNTKGTGYVLIIPEQISVPLDSLPEIALRNAQNADPNAKIEFREKRVIHGQEVWCLKISATVSKVPLLYYGYLYSGTAGTVQVLTYTTPAAFDQVEADFTEFLNSIQVVPDLAKAADTKR